MCLIIADIFHNNAARMAPTDPGQTKSVLTVRITDPDVTPVPVRHLTASKPLRERRSARPASFPVGTPSDSADCPFTRTCRIPVAYTLGLSYVARSSTCEGSKIARSAYPLAQRSPASPNRSFQQEGWSFGERIPRLIARWRGCSGSEYGRKFRMNGGERVAPRKGSPCFEHRHRNQPKPRDARKQFACCPPTQ